MRIVSATHRSPAAMVADGRFRQLLVDNRKRLDPPSVTPLGGERFWCHGVVRNQGVHLRRDLIRQGWFKP